MGQKLSVSKYSVGRGKLKSTDFAGRLAVISDLHCCSFGDSNEKLIQKIIDYKPDALLIAGDLVTGARPDKAYIALDFLAKISSRMEVIYVFGNHERRLFELSEGNVEKPELYTKYEQESGFEYYGFISRAQSCAVLLRNSHISLLGDERVQVYGLDAPLEYYRRGAVFTLDVMEALIGRCDRRCYNILLAHDPKFFPVYEQWGADLVLSGHIHGGLVRLPLIGGMFSPRYEIFPRYSGGRYRINRSTMLLSRGLGSHTIPIRIFNNPEIMIVDFV